jgi:hypothetical protein
MERGGREYQEGKSGKRVMTRAQNPRHGEREHYIVHKPNTCRKHENARGTPVYETWEMKPAEVRSGASRALRGNAETLATHGAGKERRDRRMHPTAA